MLHPQPAELEQIWDDATRQLSTTIEANLDALRETVTVIASTRGEAHPLTIGLRAILNDAEFFHAIDFVCARTISPRPVTHHPGTGGSMSTPTPAPVALELRISQQLVITSNMRLDWRGKANRTNGLRTLAATRWHDAHKAGAQPLDRAECWATLTFRDHRRRDAANWHPTLTAIIDGMVDGTRHLKALWRDQWAPLLPDDSTAYLRGPFAIIGEPDRTLQPNVALRIRLEFKDWPA